ncbi:MAG: beta-ketoacyl-ACP synthase II [Chloroflexota bacterium]
MVRRVVVTGMGAVTPVGNDVPTMWANVCQGKSGIGPITNFDASQYRTRIAAEVKGLDPLAHFSRKDIRRLDPFVQYALIAAREAVARAALSLGDGLNHRTAVILGSGIGGMCTVMQQTQVLLERGPDRVSPMLIPMILPESGASMVSIEFGFKGPNMAVTSACATAANAIGEAYGMVRHGLVDVALCGGAEKGVMPLAVAGFSAMRAISERNDEPERASRPFDRDRDGFVIGEGAAVLVIEALEHAQARGAVILAEIIGYGSNDDAYHITAPDPDGAGATACMRLALESAAVQPAEIDYVNAHGTSTPLNDVTETRAIKAALGERAYDVPISSTKSVMGHMLGAGGAAEAIVCIESIRHGIVPPTMNLDNPDPECDLDYVPNRARQQRVRTALSNSFGFGGHNACLIFRQVED